MHNGTGPAGGLTVPNPFDDTLSTGSCSSMRRPLSRTFPGAGRGASALAIAGSPPVPGSAGSLRRSFFRNDFGIFNILWMNL